MVYREVHRVELRELLRRWQAGESTRTIARATGIARNTVDKYLKAAESLGLSSSGSPPTDEQLSQLLRLGSPVSPNRDAGSSERLLAGHQTQLEAWLEHDHLQLTRIQELLAGRGCVVPYTSLRRFVAKQGLGATPKSTVRLPETKPGQYAEFDFGRLGYIVDSTTNRRILVWALVVVLSFSRHMFVWPLIHQTLTDIIEGLDAAWRFFSGVPRYLILDNCPAAIAGPDPFTPKLTRGFLEYAQFRGFIPDPTRVRHPKDKPHVERGIPYVRERFFKGATFLDLAHLRSQAPRWCLEIAGTRIHGTTRRLPLQVFRDEEQASLLPFDPKPYDVPSWARLQVHLDHHVAYQYALYSVPFDLCPPRSSVEVCADSQLVRIYHRGNLVKTHPRQARGGRSTDPTDYPPERSRYATREPARLRKLAAELGPNVGEFASRLLDDDLGPWARFRQTEKLLRLAQRYTPSRLDLACGWALSFDLLDVRRLERILREALEGGGQSDAEGHPESTPEGPGEGPDAANRGLGQPALSARFARPGSAFVHPGNPGTSNSGPSPAAANPATSGAARSAGASDANGLTGVDGAGDARDLALTTVGSPKFPSADQQTQNGGKHDGDEP